MQKIWTFVRLYAFRFKGWYAVGLLALLATNLLSVAVPSFLASALESIFPSEGTTPAHSVNFWVAAILAAAFGLIIVRVASRLLIFIPGREAEYLLKNDYFRHLLRLQPPFFRRNQLGDLLSRGSNDIQFIRVLIGFAGLQILNVAFTLPLNLYMMVGISWKLTLGCVVPLSGALIVMRYGVRAMMTHMRAAQEELSALSDEVLESYNGVRVVQEYGAERAMLERFDHRNEKYVQLLVRIMFIRSFLLPVVTVVGNLGILVLLYWGGRMVASQEMHFGAVSAFAVYVANIVSALTMMGWVINVVQRGQISLSRVLEVLEATPDLPPVVSALPEGDLGLELRGLSFHYPDAEGQTVLSDLNLTLPAGATLGIFGATGSGKSTLLRLLTRLETPPPGTVLWGGVDARDVPLSDLRQAVAVVSQAPYLFSRTLRENVGIASQEAAPDEERVAEAVRLAALTRDVAALPEGLDTLVGERGVTLSGGQRQRTALARAFFRHSRVLILDDTLSAVDTDTEQRLIDAIYEGAEGRTTVLVSHRVSALSHADEIIVLDRGQIVQRGTHRDLVAAGGSYAEAWEAQKAEQAATGEAAGV